MNLCPSIINSTINWWVPRSSDSIVYREPCGVNGIEWRLISYPKGNGLSKGSYLSVFLELLRDMRMRTRTRYDYKIELLNHLNSKKPIVREHSSEFDIGECWVITSFWLSLTCRMVFLVWGTLCISLSVRKLSYRSLVSDQQKFIEVLQNRLNCIENPAP
jgi:hypothetical protein